MKAFFYNDLKILPQAADTKVRFLKHDRIFSNYVLIHKSE